jgi:hypothetical protein
MRAVGDATPVRHVTLLLQDAWLGFGWDWTRTLIVAGFLAGAAVVTMLVSLGRLGGEG